MHSYAGKSLRTNRKSVTDRAKQQQDADDPVFQFVNHRPEAMAQSKQQAMIESSSQVTQLQLYQEMTNNSSQVKQGASLQTMADNYSGQHQLSIQKKDNKTGLPDRLKTGVENLSGYSMDDVKVHYNSDSPAQLKAHAFAQGTHIHLGPGQERHLPHEAWHVVQQKQGRVRSTMQMKGISINDDGGLEREADVMGGRALQMRTGVSKQSDLQNTRPDSKHVQRARIVQKPAVLGFHHWELQYGGDAESGLGAPGQIGAISATEDREARGSSAKSGKLLKGKAFIRVVDKHLSGYSLVEDLEDNTIDSAVSEAAAKLKGQSLPFNQISNNCQDFVTGIWNDVGGTPDPSTYNERNKIVHELTRSPTPEEVEQNLADMYLYM